MKTCMVALALLMVLGACVSVSASGENLPAKGTRQVMFGFGGGHLGNYEGGIGLRYYVREKTVLRLGLDVGWTKDDDTGWDHDIDEGEDPRQTTYTQDASSFSTGLGAMLERHFRSTSSMVPYVGLGAFYRYDKSRSEETFYREWRDETSSYVYESNSHSIEGVLLGGLQWHLAPNMSLAGEYQAKLRYSDREYERTQSRDGDHYREYDSAADYDLTFDTSRLWLSIAF